MSRAIVAVIGTAFLFAGSVAANPGSSELRKIRMQASCEAVLRPTDIRFRSNYNELQAFLYINAEHEYNRLESMTSEQRQADAVYGAFSGEYGDSQTASDFSESVRNRLVQEGFNYSASQATAYSRNGPTDDQVAAWSECMGQQNDSAFILVTSDRISGSTGTFPVRLNWRFAGNTDASAATIRLQIIGGTVNGEEIIEIPQTFSGQNSIALTPNANAESVTVIANIPGDTDSLFVDLRPPRPLEIATVVRECDQNDNCDRIEVYDCLSSADRPDEILPGLWMAGPQSPDFPTASHPTYGIEFGPWENTQCGTSGTGWHAGLGSCGTGQGTRQARCARVRVLTQVLRPALP